MAKIGHISEFNVTNADWDIYVECRKLFLKANAVKNDMKVATFLTIMGNEAYKKLRTLCAPEPAETKSFDELVQIMRDKGAKPKPTEIAAIDTFSKIGYKPPPNRSPTTTSVSKNLPPTARRGWEENLKPFYNRRLELSLFNGIIMLGTRVVVPTKFQGQILDEIHSGHLGVVKMKSVARTYVYWPKIDQQIEEKARGCPGCRQVRKAPPTT